MSNKVSIIVPVYNSEKTIDNCINSIISQSYSEIEIIIINDGSKDSSYEKILEIKKMNKNIKIINIENHGVSYARNLGIKEATGDYIMFVDSDDVIDRKMVEILVKNMIDLSCDMSACSYQVINCQSIDDNPVIPGYIVDNKYAGLFNLYKSYSCNKMYKKNIIMENDVFFDSDIHMCEDMLFNFKYLGCSKKVFYTPSRFYGYYIHNENSSLKVDDKWYSIFDVYTYAIKNYLNLEKGFDSILILNYLFIIFEARVRCKVQGYNFSKKLKKYNINYKNLIYKYFFKIIFNKNVTIKDKIRLFMFYFMYPLSYHTKRKRMKV